MNTEIKSLPPCPDGHGHAVIPIITSIADLEAAVKEINSPRVDVDLEPLIRMNHILELIDSLRKSYAEIALTDVWLDKVKTESRYWENAKRLGLMGKLKLLQSFDGQQTKVGGGK